MWIGKEILKLFERNFVEICETSWKIINRRYIAVYCVIFYFIFKEVECIFYIIIFVSDETSIVVRETFILKG